MFNPDTFRTLWCDHKKDYNVSTYAEFTKFCNNELNLDKSRSVYHRIIHKDGGYAPVNKG